METFGVVLVAIVALIFGGLALLLLGLAVYDRYTAHSAAVDEHASMHNAGENQ